MEVVKLYLMDKLSTINGSIMPTTGTINTQQILQMGTVAEKLQHTIQHLPLTTTQQVQDDETSVNELKQVEIQEPEKLEPSDQTKSEGKRRREIRLRNQSKQANDLESPPTLYTQDNIFNAVSDQGQKINITI
jgi:hypothetical protein